MTRPRKRVLHAVTVAAVLAACGGGGEREPETYEPAVHTGAEQTRAPRDGMEVSGLMGTIPEREVHAALEPKLGGLQRCIARGSREVEFIAGRMEFYFRVDAGGRVESVYPRSSTVGHRATEQCLLAAARGTRFPEPQGGSAAEFAWSFEINPPEDVRAPDDWPAAQVQAVLAEQTAALESCALAGGGLQVTAYVAPGGKVTAAGASAESLEAAAAIDCVLAAVAAWPMPDPGSYAAKVSFALP